MKSVKFVCLRVSFTEFYLTVLDVNKYMLPLWFRPGNRYEVTVYGRQREGSRVKVVCENSIEFRTGEGF